MKGKTLLLLGIVGGTLFFFTQKGKKETDEQTEEQSDEEKDEQTDEQTDKPKKRPWCMDNPGWECLGTFYSPEHFAFKNTANGFFIRYKMYKNKKNISRGFTEKNYVISKKGTYGDVSISNVRFKRRRKKSNSRKQYVDITINSKKYKTFKLEK